MRKQNKGIHSIELDDVSPIEADLLELQSDWVDDISNLHKEYWRNRPDPEDISEIEIDEIPRMKLYNESLKAK